MFLRARLLTAPWWVLSLLYGSVFGTATGLWSAISDPAPWQATVGGAVVGGLVFGGLLGPWTARQARSQREAMGDLALRDTALVNRAARRGAVPQDPELRRAALRTSEHALGTVLGQRTFGIILFSVLAVMSLLFVRDSPWWLMATGVFVIALVGQWFTPRRLRHRIALLSAPDDESDAARPT